MESVTTAQVLPPVSDPSVVPQKEAPAIAVAAGTPSSIIYAGFWRRFLATLIDSLILGTVSFFINLVPSIVLGLSSAPVVPGQNGTLAISPVALIVSSIVSLAILAIELGYFIFFIGSRGQTLGKMAMGIRVVKIGTNEAPGYGKAFLREVVGKFVSSLVLLLGYFWMLWDSKKQTWHDKIAGTVVIKTS